VLSSKGGKILHLGGIANGNVVKKAGIHRSGNIQISFN
jgi:hypothetical protein